MQTVTIKKAKLTKGHTLEVELIEKNEDGTTNEVTKKCSQLAHIDMRNAFAKLAAHLCLICDLKEGDRIGDLDNFNPEDFSQIKVNSFSIGGDAESEGVCLSGFKKIGDKVLNLTTPFTKYDADDYGFSNDLAADISACIGEVEAYLLEGKYAVKQLELPFPEEKTGATVTGENEITITDASAFGKTLKRNIKKFKNKVGESSPKEVIMEMGEPAEY